MAPRLSLCMIVKDEIDHLEACLDSVHGLVDEVAIMDTGSSDGTWPLVRLQAHKAGQMEWPDHFAEARNAALDLATGDWVLILDGDEELVDGADAIRAAIADPHLLAAELRLRNDLGDGTTGEFWAPRLFRRLPDIRFEGRIHEQVLASCQARMKREPSWSVRRVDATILHLGYRPEVFEKRGKAARNVRLLEQALDELPADAPVHRRVYIEYKLATALGQGPVGQGQLLRAAGRLLGADLETRRRLPLAPELLVAASQVWARGGTPETALEAAEAARDLCPEHPMVHLVVGQARLGMGNLEGAAQDFSASRAFTSREPAFYYDAIGHDVATCIGEATIAQRRADPEEALGLLGRLLERHPGHREATLAWLHGLVQAGQAKRALIEALEYLKTNSKDRAGLLACAEAADALGMHDRAGKWRAKALG